LVKAGFDAILSNENDRPYEFDAGPESAGANDPRGSRGASRRRPHGVDFL